jgi:hypothetical protein
MTTVLIVGATRGLGAALPQITAIDISTEPALGLVLATGSALPAHAYCSTIYTVRPVFVVQALARAGKVRTEFGVPGGSRVVLVSSERGRLR